MRELARKLHFDSLFDSLQGKFDPLGRFVHLFAESLDRPILIKTEMQRGFRFKEPDVRHFCLLKAARAVSALNAGLHLAREGYTQEIGVLMRTLVECTTDIEFVLPLANRDASTKLRAAKYIQDYFADNDRGDPSLYKRAQVKRKTVHRALGADLDNLIGVSDRSNYRSVNTEQLLDNVYQNTSSYVHAKYPETMDMYGGVPGRFHLCGMSGTPKDYENYEILDTYSNTVSTNIRLIIAQLNLRPIVQKDDQLREWYANQFPRASTEEASK
jgi:hypothetical protein